MNQITNNIIKNAVISAIDHSFPNNPIYGERITENSDEDEINFFSVRFIQPTHNQELNNRYIRTYPCVVQYFDYGRSNTDMYDVSESLTEALEAVKVYDDVIMYGRNMSFTVQEEILSFFVTYTIQVTKIEDIEKLRELDLEVRVVVEE